ncbi:hypothetical protein V866_000890 [Kwoniella sp. B9012]
MASINNSSLTGTDKPYSTADTASADPTGRPSGTFNFPEDDGSTTQVKYKRTDDGKYSYFTKNGLKSSSRAPASIDELYRGNKLEYSIYRSVMGDKAKPPPEEATFTYTSMKEDGTVEERNVRLTAHKSEDGRVTYGISESAGNEGWSISEQSLEDIKSGKFGKNFTDAFNEYMESRGGGSTFGTGDTASQNTFVPVPNPTSVA